MDYSKQDLLDMHCENKHKALTDAVAALRGLSREERNAVVRVAGGGNTNTIAKYVRSYRIKLASMLGAKIDYT